VPDWRDWAADSANVVRGPIDGKRNCTGIWLPGETPERPYGCMRFGTDDRQGDRGEPLARFRVDRRLLQPGGAVLEFLYVAL
jgi:hypothetical protein